MTPEDRYALQKALAALEEAASAIRHVLDVGTNPHLPDDYAARLRQGVTGMKPCICDFGWQPECPQHPSPAAINVADHQGERPRAKTGVKIDPMFPTPTPEQEVQQEAAVQRLDAAIRAEKGTAAKADHPLPSPPPWYGQADCATEDRLLAQQAERVNPAKASHNRLLIRSHLPGVEHFNEPPAPRPPTPKDVFGGR